MITCVKEPGYVVYVHMLILKKIYICFPVIHTPCRKMENKTNKRHPTLTVQELSVHVLLATSLAFILPGLGIEPRVSCTICTELCTSRASSLGLLGVGFYF